jgi:DUF917 family protein
LSRQLKVDPVINLLQEQNGVLLFSGKITSVERHVGAGFTRGSVMLEAHSNFVPANSTLCVDFENENLNAILKQSGKDEQLLAICPDLITFLDKANGAPLGVSDYKYVFHILVGLISGP